MSEEGADTLLETDYFKRSRPDYRRLSAFGFRMDQGVYTYRELLPDGQFRAELLIAEDGGVTGRIIDTDTDEEYLPIRLENPIGSFSGNVREMYLEFLAKVGRACFVPVHFMFDQANRAESWISREYGVDAEFPWARYPGNGTFKCGANGKWFAALLTVEFGKLSAAERPAGANGLGSTVYDGSTAHGGSTARDGSTVYGGSTVYDGSSAHDEDEVVEVINLKANPDDIPELIKTPGIYPAWHMNKKHWVSVILDDTLTDPQVFDLIRQSYDVVAGGKPQAVRSTGAWMIPSNPKVYDVDAGFRRGGGEIEWHQHNNIEPGDEVFIYCSAPYSALIYRCEVVAADLRYRGMFKESKGYERAMRIRLIEKYPPDKYPLPFIKAHGGSVVRSARRMPEELYAAVKASR